MSAPQSAALTAITFQLAAALDQYDLQFDALLRNWPDMDAYQGVSKGIDELRLYTAALPELSVAYVSLLIAHAEVVHCLWKRSNAQACTEEQFAGARDAHRVAVAGLRRRCLRALAEQTEKNGGRRQ
jgi:phage-related protein